MKNRRLFFFLGFFLAVPLFAQVPQPLPFKQDWTNINLIVVDNNWNTVPGIIGFRGDGMTSATGVDPQTVLADPLVPINVLANQTNPNTLTTGGVAEFQITNPTIALMGSGTARAPYIRISVSTLGRTNVRVSYSLRDIDGSLDNSVQPVALQFRVGAIGTFTNVPAAFVPDATDGPSLATRVTAVSVILPSAADNQPVVQLRIITTDAVGNDEWVGIDDIEVGVLQTLMVVGAAQPSSVSVGGTTLLTATVTPVSDPPASTGITVTGDLSSIGGLAMQQFFDDATNGDLVAGDNIFSFTAPIPTGTTPGNKSLPISASDAEGRTASATIALTVFTPLSVSGLANPPTTSVGGTSLLTATVTPATSPASTGITVTGDLSLIGGLTNQPFFDDGTNGDVVPGDNIFSFRVTIPAGVTEGLKSLPVSASDAQSRTASTTIPLTVVTPLSVSGLANPSTAAGGETSLLTATVTPATGPASTGITVIGDLTSIGGLTNQPFFDDGTNGDMTAGDNVFSFRATIAGGTTDGLKSLPVSASDAQSRTASTSISLTIVTHLAVVGQANPSTASAGESSLLTATVTPATGPPSTGITVVGDLSSVGGLTNQPFFDDGTNGDMVAGDNIFSFRATIATGTADGLKSLPVMASDAQSRSATANIELTVVTRLSVSGLANPATASAGGTSLLTATVTPATGPASTGINVTGDLSSIGGLTNQPFFDDGTNGDMTPGDNVFSFRATVAVGTTDGLKLLPVSASDAQARTAVTTISLTVVTELAVSGHADPSSAQIGGSSLLTATVTPATGPASTGITVVGDLSSVGGLTNQPFFDDGTHGDMTAGDNVFSFRAMVATGGVTAGLKSLPVSASDAQSRTANATIAFTVDPSTGLAISGLADPSSASSGGTTLLTATVTPATGPASTGISVIGDLSSIGGLTNQPFFDDATNGDVTAGDHVFSYRATVAAGVAAGLKSLPVSASDAESRTASTAIAFTVVTPLAVSGSANPSSVPPGGTSLLTAIVTPATGPASTGITVSGDLSAIGGLTAQPFFDDGTNGDVTAADHIFSYHATVASGTASGSKSLPVTARDAESRTASATIALTVQVSAPVANAGDDQTVECRSHTGTIVTLNGSGSSDPDGDALTYSWREGGNIIAGPTRETRVQVALSFGSHTIELTVDDGNGGAATDQVVVHVVDTTAPAIDVLLNPQMLWPPNKRLVEVTATVTVSDSCDEDPSFVLLSITSNEPVGPGDGRRGVAIMGADFNTADTQFKLRADRLGEGNGRVYTVIYRVTDGAGNSTDDTATVVVPHDMGSSDAGAGLVGLAEEVPTEFSMDQNYPNPFNPSTMFRFGLPKAAFVTLKIYNLIGQEVAVLVSGQLSEGFHQAEWNAGILPSGIYIFRLMARDPADPSGKVFVETRKLLLMK